MGVGAPFLDERLHVGGDGAVEIHLFARGGMLEAEGLGVQRLSRTDGEAVVDELVVGGCAIAA